MYKKIKVKNKDIMLYCENIDKLEELPIVVYHSYTPNIDELWNGTLKLNCKNFVLVGISNIKWDDEMTPYYMEALFKGDNECLGKADEYLKELENDIVPKIKEELSNLNIKIKEWNIVGYSLSGLFAIYSMYKIDLFSKYVSCSGSFWYRDFDKFVFENKPVKQPKQIYLSLGDKESFCLWSSNYKCPNCGHYLEPSLNVARDLNLVCENCHHEFMGLSAEEYAFNSDGA